MQATRGKERWLQGKLLSFFLAAHTSCLCISIGLSIFLWLSHISSLKRFQALGDIKRHYINTHAKTETSDPCIAYQLSLFLSKAAWKFQTDQRSRLRAWKFCILYQFFSQVFNSQKHKSLNLQLNLQLRVEKWCSPEPDVQQTTGVPSRSFCTKVEVSLLPCHWYSGSTPRVPPQAIGALILSRTVAQFHPAAIHFVCTQTQLPDSCDQADSLSEETEVLNEAAFSQLFLRRVWVCGIITDSSQCGNSWKGTSLFITC